MTANESDLLLRYARQSAIGFVLTGPPPKVLGSGVLMSVGEAYGILTCAHVAKEYEKLEEIGLVRFERETGHARAEEQANPQFRSP